MPITCVHEIDNCVKITFVIIVVDIYTENYRISVNNLI